MPDRRLPLKIKPLAGGFIVVAAILTGAPAEAWELLTHTDPFTDQKSSWVEVDSRSDAGSLRIYCERGRLAPVLLLDPAPLFGTVGIRVRFDDGAIESRSAHLSADRAFAQPWLIDPPEAIAKLSSAKRLRVEVTVDGIPRLFQDYDVRGTEAALGLLDCTR